MKSFKYAPSKDIQPYMGDRSRLLGHGYYNGESTRENVF